MNKTSDFIIENGILKAYNGDEKVVCVPDGVVCIGGIILKEEIDKEYLRASAFEYAYKAFYCNKTIEEVVLPDSVTAIGFKSFLCCENLKTMTFSANLKKIECCALTNCINLKIIIFKGSIYEFCLLDVESHNGLDLDEVICSDGTIKFHREHYIDELHFPGTREEWNFMCERGNTGWLKRRAKKVICTDD
ncbi:MAG: leucine-rich repeat protein [Clostridia bacterium]|nr:leucine-rich repeat protein [Clostridia bacterium]